MERAIDVELAEELAFLVNYDNAKKPIQEIVDIPDRKIDLFIQSCVQNNCRLWERKCSSHFVFLTDQELRRMEETVRNLYDSENATETPPDESSAGQGK